MSKSWLSEKLIKNISRSVFTETEKVSETNKPMKDKLGANIISNNTSKIYQKKL